jgi:hypothetical protein
MVPATATVVAGGTTVHFPVKTHPVGTAITATITGEYLATQTASLTIVPQLLSSLSVSPATVQGGNSSTGTVTLAIPAPAGGIDVALSSDNAAATVPASATVASGATTATFTVATSPVVVPTSATISATHAGITLTASLAIVPPALSSLSMSPVSVAGGNSSSGTVTLVNPAPAGGALVTLSDDSPSATTPASVTVPEGATTAAFTVTTVGVGTTTNVTISASLIASTVTDTLTINAPILSSVTMSPASVIGGSSSTGTVTLSSVAPPSGAVVTLSDDSPSASTPASVVVPADATTATFTVTTQQVAAATPVTITGTFNGSANGSLTINPPNPIRVNAAGGAYTDSLAHLWSADTGFTGGSTALVPGRAIGNTVDDTLYQSERYGSFSYSFTMPEGSYLVTLKFAETHYTNSVPSGQRLFNVAINGTTVLTNFDVKFSAGGPNIAVDRTFAVNAGAGSNNMQIAFIHVAGQPDLPMVDAIEIVGGL